MISQYPTCRSTSTMPRLHYFRCKFTPRVLTPCPLRPLCANCQHLNSFSDEIVREVLIPGISDYIIPLAILQDKNQNMSLEDAFIQAKEA